MMPGFPAMLLVMAAAALACRLGGFLVMAWLPGSLRLEAALRATPVSVMAGITALALAGGQVAEAMALGAVVALTVVTRNDVMSAVAGVAIVAALRWAGL
ncbi:MAG: AzlD domain-containing protein [Gemmobacter sp.]